MCIFNEGRRKSRQAARRIEGSSDCGKYLLANGGRVKSSLKPVEYWPLPLESSDSGLQAEGWDDCNKAVRAAIRLAGRRLKLCV